MKNTIELIIKNTVKETSRNIMLAIKRIVMGLIKLWVAWLIFSILLISIIGGWAMWVIAVMLFVTLFAYSIISLVINIKKTSIQIAMEIPIIIAKEITCEIINNAIPHIAESNTIIAVELADNISRSIIEVIRNPHELIYNPKKTVETVKEVLDVISTFTLPYLPENTESTLCDNQPPALLAANDEHLHI